MKRFTILLSVMLIAGFTCPDLSASKKYKEKDSHPMQDKNKIPKKEKESATAALRNSASQRKPKQLEQSVSIVPTTSSSSSSSSSLLHSHLLPGGFSGQASTSSSSSSSTLSSSFELPTLKKIKKETKININYFPKHDKDEKKEIDPNMLSPLVGDLDKASHDFNMDVFGKDPALREAIIHSLQDQDAKGSSSSSSQVDLYGRTEGPSSSSSSLSSATQNFLVETDGKTHEVKVVAQQNSLLIRMPDVLLREIFLTSVGQSRIEMIMTLENLSLVNKKFHTFIRNIIENNLNLRIPSPYPIHKITIAGIIEGGNISNIIQIILAQTSHNTDLLQAYKSAVINQSSNVLDTFEAKIFNLIAANLETPPSTNNLIGNLSTYINDVLHNACRQGRVNIVRAFFSDKKIRAFIDNNYTNFLYAGLHQRAIISFFLENEYTQPYFTQNIDSETNFTHIRFLIGHSIARYGSTLVLEEYLKLKSTEKTQLSLSSYDVDSILSLCTTNYQGAAIYLILENSYSRNLLTIEGLSKALKNLSFAYMRDDTIIEQPSRLTQENTQLYRVDVLKALIQKEIERKKKKL